MTVAVTRAKNQCRDSPKVFTWACEKLNFNYVSKHCKMCVCWDDNFEFPVFDDLIALNTGVVKA